MCGNRYLKAVDAITCLAPHTNQAAKKARCDGDALQHHFGAASYFLNVTPDNDNKFIVQVYSGVVIDNKLSVSRKFDEELASH